MNVRTSGALFDIFNKKKEETFDNYGFMLRFPLTVVSIIVRDERRFGSVHLNCGNRNVLNVLLDDT